MAFDLTDRESFIDVDNWMSKLENYCADNIACILVGCKSDLENRRVAFDEAEDLANKYCTTYIDISSRTGDNISLVFQTIAKKLVDLDKNRSKLSI